MESTTAPGTVSTGAARIKPAHQATAPSPSRDVRFGSITVEEAPPAQAESTEDQLRKLFSMGRLTVRVDSASGLLAKDKGGTSDPFCTVKPGGFKKQKTKVIKKTLDAEWSEVCTYLNIWTSLSP